MAETLALFEAGEVVEIPQEESVGETLQMILPERLAEGKARLAEGRYNYLVD
jgi:hypothetical protein